MRVLWITPGFAADERDFNCIPPMQLLAQALTQQGVDLQIVTLEYPFRDEPYDWHGATIWPCNGQNRRWLKGRTLWRARRFCRRILEEKTTTVVHSFWLGWASALGEKLSQSYDIPHVTTLMGQDVLPQNWKFLRGLSPERAARLVAVSDFQNDVFEKNTGLRAAKVIPWGVVEAEIPAIFSSERPLDVLGAGSLVPVKNWEKWLHVIALVVKTVPDLKAEIVGGGVEQAKLERLSRQLNLEKNVRFTGELPRPEVLKKMRTAKIFLHTAHYESFGYVLAEAAMNGCRVLGTPVGAAMQFGETAEKEEDLAALLQKTLKQNARKDPFVISKMQETMEVYLKMYQK